MSVYERYSKIKYVSSIKIKKFVPGKKINETIEKGEIKAFKIFPKLNLQIY